MSDPSEQDLSVTSPSGRTYCLASPTMPPAEQAHYNYGITGDYLRDVLETAVASGPPEVAPLLVGSAISAMLRSLPTAWLREYAYAGVLRRAEGLADEALEGILNEDDALDGQAGSSERRDPPPFQR